MPQRFHVIIQPRASGDLTAICAYIEKQSPQNAASVAQAILDAIDSLEYLHTDTRFTALAAIGGWSCARCPFGPS